MTGGGFDDAWTAAERLVRDHQQKIAAVASALIRFYKLDKGIVPRRLSSALGLVSSKAAEALLMKLRILNRATLLAHTRLAERRVFLEQPLVVFALHDVPLRRPGW